MFSLYNQGRILVYFLTRQREPADILVVACYIVVALLSSGTHEANNHVAEPGGGVTSFSLDHCCHGEHRTAHPQDQRLLSCQDAPQHRQIHRIRQVRGGRPLMAYHDVPQRPKRQVRQLHLGVPRARQRAVQGRPCQFILRRPLPGR